MTKFSRGFSLVELMIAVAVVAILVTLSYPSYASFIRKSHRTDAQMALLDWANRQQAWRADNPNYNTGITPAATAYYTFSMVNTAASFTLTATAIGRQTNDKEGETSCTTLTLNHNDVRGPAGHLKCWRK